MFCLHGVALTDPCLACAAEGEGNTRQPGPPYNIPGVLINEKAAVAYKLLRDAHGGFPSPLWCYALCLIVVSIAKNLGTAEEEIHDTVQKFFAEGKVEVVH